MRAAQERVRWVWLTRTHWEIVFLTARAAHRLWRLIRCWEASKKINLGLTIARGQTAIPLVEWTTLLIETAAALQYWVEAVVDTTRISDIKERGWIKNLLLVELQLQRIDVCKKPLIMKSTCFQARKCKLYPKGGLTLALLIRKIPFPKTLKRVSTK